jgi:hypothetical protein
MTEEEEATVSYHSQRSISHGHMLEAGERKMRTQGKSEDSITGVHVHQGSV